LAISIVRICRPWSLNTSMVEPVGKMTRPSLLYPKAGRRSGKA